MKINKLFNPVLKMKYVFAALLCLGLFQANTVKAQATGDAWGYACGFTAGDPVQGNMYQFDLNTGDETELGPLCGGAPPQVLAGEFANGIYYVLANDTRELRTVDATGACTTVGTITPDPGGVLIGLSHDVSTGITYMLSDNDLFIIDLTTANVTAVGTVGGAGLLINLAIGEQSDAFILDIVSDNISQIDLSTGQVIPGTTFSLFDINGPIDLNFAQSADFDCDQATGLLYGMIYRGGGTGELGTINPATGEFIQTAFIGTEICGFSFNTTAAVVPTMSQWGLFLFALLMVNLGLVFMYRQERTLNLA